MHHTRTFVTGDRLQDHPTICVRVWYNKQVARHDVDASHYNFPYRRQTARSLYSLCAYVL